MRSGVRYSIGKRVLKKLVSSRDKEKLKTFIPFHSANEFLVVWDESQNENHKSDIQTLLEFLHKQGKNVYRVIYHHTPKIERPSKSSDGKVFHFCRKDFNSLGLPKTMVVKKVIAHQFDYLINMNLDGRLALNSIIGFSNAKIRVGHRKYGGFGFYDLLIGNYNNENLRDYVADLKLYLQKIG